jgi:hypothetical protein
MAIDMKEVRLRCLELASTRYGPSRGEATPQVIDTAEEMAQYVANGKSGAEPKKPARGAATKDKSKESDPLA